MARLGDICEIVSGTTPKSNVSEYWDGGINWVTPAELDEETTIIYESQRKITEQAVKDSSLRPFPAGTVLLSSRAPIGKVAIAGVEMYCNQGFKNLICSKEIHNKYRGSAFGLATYKNAVSAISALYILIFYLAKIHNLEFYDSKSEYIFSDYAHPILECSPMKKLPDFEGDTP